MLIMREVMTVIGPTADIENRSPSLPLAVREWCINTPAINPATNSIFTPSEDGRTYRWNLITNSLSEWVTLGPGVGEPYVPTVIGPDGTVFTLNGGSLWALGNLNGVGVAVTSSTPDVRSAVVGQSLTFTASVTNPGTGPTPTGTATFTDTTYAVVNATLQTTTVTLASNVPLDANGNATFTSSSLTADEHFITAQYSGDANFSPGSASLVQAIHNGASSTALTSTPNPSSSGQSVTFTATVSHVPPATGTPTGQVTFTQGNTVLAQAPVNSSGQVSFSTSTLAAGSDTITAAYASDSLFAASSGSTVQTVQSNFATTTTVTSSPNPSVFGQSVTFTATVTSSGGVPVGTVTFSEGSTVLASNVAVDGSGHAAFNTSSLAVGSHTITASFTGNATWGNSSGSDSASPQVVNKAGTTTTVSSSGNPSVFSQSVTFTAAVTANSPGSGIPTGTVTFKDGNTT